MLSFASSLAGQIGYVIARLNKDNYKSALLELSQLTEYGLDGTVMLLRICLEQVHSREGEVQDLQLKLELLASVIRTLVHQPNFSTTFCEAVRQIVQPGVDFLGKLSQALKLSLPEQIRLGLALSDAEELTHRQEGQTFCELKIVELYQNPVPCESEALIADILRLLKQSEGLSKHVLSFVTALSSISPDAESSLLLTPLLNEEVNEVNCLRKFEDFSASGQPTVEDMVQELSTANNAADVMEELGYSCTSEIEHCKEILGLFSTIRERDVALLVGMVARTHRGLEDLEGSHGTFSTALCKDEHLPPDHMTTWNVDVLLEALKQLVPNLDWVVVMENMDQEGFYLPDQKAFTTLMSIFKRSCQDPFPIQAICGAVWKNGEGQISFLRHAVSAPPDVFTFSHSPRKQPPIEILQVQRSLYGTPNHAWLSLDLLEVLCLLAEMGHASSVRSLLEHPMKHCPELLVIGMAQIKTECRTIQSEIFSAILPAMFISLTHTAVLHQLWLLNRAIVIRGMVDLHLKDPSSLLRLSDVCQELKVLADVLNTTPFSFAIDLAALASRRERMNLEKWLQKNMTIHRDAFFQACLKFLRERRLAEARSDGASGSAATAPQSAPVISLSLDTTAIFFKVLQAYIGQSSSRDLAEELKRVYAAAVRVNPRLLSVGAPEQSPSEVFAADIEEEANSYFQRIYVGQLTIDDVVGMLERFNESAVQRERDIFSCMIRCLFDEYQFFPRYPERELGITAVLFGSLIKHQLVSSITLGIALRGVLDALRKPLDSKMFSFGLTALDKFVDRLVEWPQYCNHILQISHMRDARADLVEIIECSLARVSASQVETVGNVLSPVEQTQMTGGQVLNLGSHPAPESSEASGTGVISEMGDRRLAGDGVGQPRFAMEGSDGIQHSSAGAVQQREHIHQQQPQQAVLALQQFQQQQQALEERHKTTGASLKFGSNVPQLAPSVTAQVTQSLFDSKPAQTSQASSYQPSGNGQLATGSSSIMRQSRSGLTSALPQPSVAAAFGHAINIETLVAAAERKDIQHEAPSLEVQDKVAFVINNISIANLEPKAKEFLDVVKEQFYPWFAQYMVMKRASIEPNFHDTYLEFLDKINSKVLHKEVVKATYENCKVLLRSELIKSISEERSLLKNLGSWLGKLTIGRNQALRAKEIDFKSLITEAYEKGLMIAVIPFTSKILEPCQSSLAYQPPNPWTMGILGLLAEIYALPNLKLNLKFDIEVLCKKLAVDMKDVKPTQLLKGRVRDIESNPDFSIKDYVAQHPPPPVPVSEPQSTLAAAAASVPQPAPSGHLSTSGTFALSERAASGQSSSSTVSQVSMSIPTLTTYVVFNPKLAALGQQAQLQRIIPVALDRAIREISSPVVDRSVTIALTTTRELVIKDYAMEADENWTHQSAKLMVASLSGNLAHVTCKEPLHVAMTNHLRSLLQVLNVGVDILEQAVQLVTNDNLDLGCAVIEKAATEKALRDLENAIGPSLAIRRKQREQLGASYYDAFTYSQGNLAGLPESLRPKPGRLSNSQRRVYEDFLRLPLQNQPSQGPVAPVGPATPPGRALDPGTSRGPYSVNSAQGIGGSQPTSGLGASTQPDVTLDEDEVEHTSTSLSFTSVGGVIAPDGLPRANQDGTTASLAAQSGSATEEDKGRQSKGKTIPSSGIVGLREETKSSSRDIAAADPAGLRDQVVLLFDDWVRICDAPVADDKANAVYMSQLQHSGMLKGDDVSDRFFRIFMELAVEHCLNAGSFSNQGVSGQPVQPGQTLSFAAIDMYAKLVVLLVKYYVVDPAVGKITLLNKVLNVTVKVIQRDADEKKTAFHPRPYFRLFLTWLIDFNSADPALDSSNYEVLTAFRNALLTLQPLWVPSWSFAWLELISHRIFMPKLLLSDSQKGWPLFQKLLVAHLKFLEPFLRNADLTEPLRFLYKGTLRVLLVLLHDFPEFLCDHHFSFCDVIPPSCIQMRNVILSAFPGNVRLPDPFTPNLKVDLLPEMSQAPRILSDVEAALKDNQLKAEIDDYLKTRQLQSLLQADLMQRLMLSQHEAVACGTRYNVPLINALVLYAGMHAIQQLQSKTTAQQLAVPTASITDSAAMDMFQMLIVELDTEGRYLFLNAVANQLRYPNNHTHYFSCILLYLFVEAKQEFIQEQITRVLLERLVVNRPHPWGLLITYIELTKNPRYNFWSRGFTRCAPGIENLFQLVARSRTGPPMKPSEDDLS